MSRQTFLDFAKAGLAMPLAVDLFAHRLSTPEKVESDPQEMARVMIEAARELNAPLAVAPMDLRVEKAALGELLGIDAGERESFHLAEPLGPEALAAVKESLEAGYVSGRMRVTAEAAGIVGRETDLLPTGMAIGPFSLITKTMEDVISAVYMIGQDLEAEDDESIELALQLLELSTLLVRNYVDAQVRAGAKAIIICEPAANTVYISPRQLEEGLGLLENMVLAPNRKVKAAIEDNGADLIFHDCGELNPTLARALGELHPVVLSLGSCVDLIEIAPLIPDDVVLFGNVPSKYFPREDEMPLEKVRAICDELLEKVGATGHPYILGSECDVLSVPGHEDSIMAKARAIAACSRWKR